jgi:hypothetical protein
MLPRNRPPSRRPQRYAGPVRRRRAARATGWYRWPRSWIQIHVHIPDGNRDKLHAGATAWNKFLNDPAIDYGGSKISDVASALRQNQTHEVADLDDLVMMLSGSVNKVYAGAKQLATECDRHDQALKQLRDQIQGALNQLEEAIALTMAVTVLEDVITAGVGIVLDAAALAADGVYIRTAAEAITGFVDSIDIDRILGLFSEEEDVVASVSKDLNEVNSIQPVEIEEDAAASTEPAADIDGYIGKEKLSSLSADDILADDGSALGPNTGRKMKVRTVRDKDDLDTIWEKLTDNAPKPAPGEKLASFVRSDGTRIQYRVVSSGSGETIDINATTAGGRVWKIHQPEVGNK